MGRQLFDHVAAIYDANRPDYPGELFDALESALGQPLLRADVLDVGAGTGIATRALPGAARTSSQSIPGLVCLPCCEPVRPRACGPSSATATRCRCARVVRPGDLRAELALDGSGPRCRRRPACSMTEAYSRLSGTCWTPTVSWFARHQERLFAACGWAGHDDESWAADLLAGPRWQRRVANGRHPVAAADVAG